MSTKEGTMSVSSLPSRSQELEHIHQRSTAPFGMLFLHVPSVNVSVPAQPGEATTRTCDETSSDGKSKLDCIDDDD